MRVLFDPPQFGNVRRFGGPRAGHNHAVHEKKFRLFDFIEDVQIASQRMGAMFLLHVAEDFDVLAAQFLAPAQQSAGAAFNQPCPAHVREDVAFHAQKIQARLVGDFERGLVGRFEHLDANRPGKALPHFPRDALHHLDRAGRERRLDVRQIVAVFQDDAVHAGRHVMA